MSNDDIQIPEEYKEKSKQIEMLWEVFLETGENLDRVVLETRTFLEEIGFSRTDAMKKIAQDHRHLKGFSLPTLYRMLPKEEKQQQLPKHRPKKDSQNENDSIPKPIRYPNDIELDLQGTPPVVLDVEPEKLPEEEPLSRTKLDEFEDRHKRDENRIFKLVEDITKTSDAFIKIEKEAQDTEQLLQEERSKTAALEERLELIQREHEAKEATLQDKINDLDALTDKLSAQLQEKSRQLTNLTMQVDNAIPEPPTEQNYSVEADIQYDGKKLPIVVRCFISGSKVGWIDRDVYKARYGREPQDE